MLFEPKPNSKPRRYLSESRVYRKAVKKLETFLKQVCRVYISNKRNIYPSLMMIRADMVNWEKTLPDDVLKKLRTNKIHIFIRKIMDEDTSILLEKYLR